MNLFWCERVYKGVASLRMYIPNVSKCVHTSCDQANPILSFEPLNNAIPLKARLGRSSMLDSISHDDEFKQPIFIHAITIDLRPPDHASKTDDSWSIKEGPRRDTWHDASLSNQKPTIDSGVEPWTQTSFGDLGIFDVPRHGSGTVGGACGCCATAALWWSV